MSFKIGLRISMKSFAKRMEPLFPDIAIMTLLLCAGIKFTWGLEKIVGLDIWDETAYLTRGVEMVQRGIPAPHYAPLYSLWYLFLSLFQSDKIKLYYLNSKLLILLLPISLFYALRCCKVFKSAALFLSYFFLISIVNLTTGPRVAHFAAVLLLMTLAFARQQKTDTRSWCVFCAGVLISAYVRPEFFIGFLTGLSLCFFCFLGSDRSKMRENIFFIISLMLFSLGLVSLLGLPMFIKDNRSFLAFGQHFALNYYDWMGIQANGWLDWKEVMLSQFGKAKTIFDAFQYAPALFLRHVLYNALGEIKQILHLFVHVNIILPFPRYKLPEALALLIVTLTFILRAVWRNKTLVVSVQGQRVLILQLVCVAFPAILSFLIIYPHPHYFIVFSQILLVGMAVLFASENVSGLWGSAALRPQLLTAGLLAVFLITPVASTKTEYFHKNERLNDNVETIDFVRQLKIKGDVRLLAFEWYDRGYLGDNYHVISALKKNTSFNGFLKKRRINMIVDSDLFQQSARYKNDTEWLDFKTHYQALGFTKLKIKNTQRALYFKEDEIKIERAFSV